MATNVLETRQVRCPYRRAEEYLADALGAAADQSEPQTIRLHAAFRDVNLEKDVLVRYEQGADPMHITHPWKISWVPVDAGPYPSFDGTLTVRADEDYTSCILELKGAYEPPLGAFGKVFDAVVGNRIATNTAQILLQQLGSRMEGLHTREEAAKK